MNAAPESRMDLPNFNRFSALEIFTLTHKAPPPALRPAAHAILTGHAGTGESVGIAGALNISQPLLHRLFSVIHSGIGERKTRALIKLLWRNRASVDQEIPMAMFLYEITQKHPKHFRKPPESAGKLVAAGLLYRINPKRLRKNNQFNAIAEIVDDESNPNFSVSAFRSARVLVPAIMEAQEETTLNEQQTLLLVLHQLIALERNGAITRTFLEHLIRDSLETQWRRIPTEGSSSAMAQAKQAIEQFLNKKQ